MCVCVCVCVRVCVRVRVRVRVCVCACVVENERGGKSGAKEERNEGMISLLCVSIEISFHIDKNSYDSQRCVHTCTSIPMLYPPLPSPPLPSPPLLSPPLPSPPLPGVSQLPQRAGCH